jgi:hypothetical protein
VGNIGVGAVTSVANVIKKGPGVSINSETQIEPSESELPDENGDGSEGEDARKIKENEEQELKLLRRELRALLKQKRSNIAIHAILCSIFELLLVLMVFRQLIGQCGYWEVLFHPPEISTLFVSFVCISIVHLTLIEPVTQFLAMAKFANNHPYIFEHPQQAFWLSMLQFITVTGIEFANVFLLLCTNDTIDLISNFVAMVIVSEFDGYVYESMKEEPLKKLLNEEFTEEAFIIRHTTSLKCGETEEATSPDEESRLLKVTWGARSCQNKVERTIYKIFRAYYVSFYYYFLPFLSMIVATFIPVYL